MWLDDDGKEAPDPSWTNFSACFTPELTKVIEGFYANISGGHSLTKGVGISVSGKKRAPVKRTTEPL